MNQLKTLDEVRKVLSQSSVHIIDDGRHWAMILENGDYFILTLDYGYELCDTVICIDDRDADDITLLSIGAITSEECKARKDQREKIDFDNLKSYRKSEYERLKVEFEKE